MYERTHVRTHTHTKLRHFQEAPTNVNDLSSLFSLIINTSAELIVVTKGARSSTAPPRPFFGRVAVLEERPEA